MRIAILVLLLVLIIPAFGQNRLHHIEEDFEKKGIIITDRVGDSIIQNQFDLYVRITSRSEINHKGRLDFSQTTRDDVSDYYNYNFSDSVTFNRVEFKNKFDFSMAKSKEGINLHQSIFYEPANFTWANFSKKSVFSRLHFKKNVEFIRTYFSGDTDFFQTHFMGYADFYGSRFMGTLNMINTSYYNPAIFSFTEMNGDCNFRQAEFHEKLLFNNAQINATIDFSGAKFDTLVDFSGSAINGTLIFTNATLPAFLDLSNLTSIKNIIDLTEVKTNENYRLCQINLVNTDLSRIKMRYEGFQLWFPENAGYEIRCNVYDALLSAFKSKGYQSSYEKLDIEYQKYKYKAKNHPVNNFIQEAWWNYGYNKEKIFVWILRFALILTVVNTFFLKSLMGNIYEMNFLNLEKVNERYTLHHPLLTFFLNIPTGFLYTVILLVGGAFGMRFRSEHIKFPSFFGLVYIISIGLLGISCSAFILNFIFEL